MANRVRSSNDRSSSRREIPVTMEPSTRTYRVRRAIAGAALAGAAAGGFIAGAVHNIHEAETHSIDYLNDYPQKTVVVQPGDTANELLNEATGGEAGQLRADELEFIGQQGTAHDPQGRPELQAGQVVVIPLPPEGK